MALIKQLADVPLDECDFVRFYDLAASKPLKGSDPDWTCGCWLAVTTGRTNVTQRGTWYVLNSERIRETPRGVEDFIYERHKRDDALLTELGIDRTTPIRIELEGGSGGLHVVDQMQRGRFAGLDFAGRRPRGSKTERARPVAIAAEARHINVVDGPWLEEWLTELELFPDGQHDDQVDAFSGAFAELAKLVRGGDGTPVVPILKRDPDRDDEGEGGWQVTL